MKAKIIRDDIEVVLDRVLPHQREHVIWKTLMRNGKKRLVPHWKQGASMEDENAHWWVRMGFALPDDDECRERAGMTDESLDAAKKAYSRAAAGIHPDDNALFDAGFISGYNPDESYKPGPKWDEYQKLLAEQEAEEEEDV